MPIYVWVQCVNVGLLDLAVARNAVPKSRDEDNECLLLSSVVCTSGANMRGGMHSGNLQSESMRFRASTDIRR